jgi:hypothetical protein
MKYLFGSRLYKSNDLDSDYDYVEIADTQIVFDKNITFFTPEEFALSLNNHDVVALEIFFSQDLPFQFELNLGKLRTSVSTITSNSWVKGKKKITVLGDYDLSAGLKSVFHSLRILDYGIQIAINGKIIDYSKSNYILDDLKKLSLSYSYDELWSKIESKYLGYYKQLKSKFKTLCPKIETDHFGEKEQLREIFARYKIVHPQLNQIIAEILTTIK